MRNHGRASEHPKEVKNGSVLVNVYRIQHRTAAASFVYAVGYVTPLSRQLRQFTNETAALSEARLKADQLAAGRIEAADVSRTDREELLVAREIRQRLLFPAAISRDRFAPRRPASE